MHLMSTLRLGAPRSARAWPSFGIARLFDAVASLCNVLAEAETQARAARERSPFAD
jgi:hypothetical protein